MRFIPRPDQAHTQDCNVEQVRDQGWDQQTNQNTGHTGHGIMCHIQTFTRHQNICQHSKSGVTDDTEPQSRWTRVMVTKCSLISCQFTGCLLLWESENSA